jgi:hypothetical protein
MPLSAEDSKFLVEKSFLDLLQDELSGDLAKDHVIAITRHHRVQGSRGYSDAAEYVLKNLRENGFTFEDAWIESFLSDGAVHYQTWQSPSGWSIDTGELRMVEPTRELLVRYPEIAMSVMTYSNAGRARAELVDVGEGTNESDYQGKDVAGKWVLATGYGGDVHRLAVVKYGAAAVVCYLDDDRAPSHPDMIQYTGIWPRTEELAKVAFGFNISNRQGRKLKNLLSQNKKVVLDGNIEGTGLERWRMEVVVATIPGSEHSDEELILTAHLDHPKESANDNASGSAAILDIARALRTLIDQGKMRQPKRTIRFLWVPEYFGTMAYIDSHPEMKGPELGGKVLAALNLDMVGEDVALLNSRLILTWTPQTIGSILPDVAADMTNHLDSLEASALKVDENTFNYRIGPFSGGSDHVVFNDGAIRVPAIMLGHWPDYTHHTTEDTPDKVDPVELERVEVIAAATVCYLAGLSEEQSLDVTNLVAANAQSRLVSETQKAVSWLLKAPEPDIELAYHDAKRVVDFALRREQQTLESALGFAPYRLTRRLIEIWTQGLEGQAELQRRTLQAIFYQRTDHFPAPKKLTPEERRAMGLVPTRLTRGPLAKGLPLLKLPEENRPWYAEPEALALDTYLLVNLIDGRRSILAIRNDLSAATTPVSLGAVERYIHDLEQVGLVKLR